MRRAHGLLHSRSHVGIAGHSAVRESAGELLAQPAGALLRRAVHRPAGLALALHRGAEPRSVHLHYRPVEHCWVLCRAPASRVVVPLRPQSEMLPRVRPLSRRTLCQWAGGPARSRGFCGGMPLPSMRCLRPGARAYVASSESSCAAWSSRSWARAPGCLWMVCRSCERTSASGRQIFSRKALSIREGRDNHIYNISDYLPMQRLGAIGYLLAEQHCVTLKEAKNNDKSLSTNSTGARGVMPRREQGRQSMTSGGSVLKNGMVHA